MVRSLLLSKDLDLHGQFTNVELGRFQFFAERIRIALLQGAFHTGEGLVSPDLQAIYLDTHFAAHGVKCFTPQQPKDYITLTTCAPSLGRTKCSLWLSRLHQSSSLVHRLLTIRVQENRGRYSEHIIFEAPPLITRARWDRLQQRLDNANSRSGRQSNTAQEFLLHDLCVCGVCGAKPRSDYGTRRADGSRSRHYACYWHEAGPKLREIKGHEKCPLPLIPAELLEWHVFYVQLMKQLGLEPEHYEPLLDGKQKWDSKIEGLVKTLSNVQASLRRKEIALRNLDSLLESTTVSTKPPTPTSATGSCSKSRRWTRS